MNLSHLKKKKFNKRFKEHLVISSLRSIQHQLTHVTHVIFSQMDDVHIRGRRGSLHFIRFPTCEMGNFLSLAKAKGMAQLVTTVCATGGGAFKFENNFKEVRMFILLFDVG